MAIIGATDLPVLGSHIWQEGWLCFRRRSCLGTLSSLCCVCLSSNSVNLVGNRKHMSSLCVDPCVTSSTVWVLVFYVPNGSVKTSIKVPLFDAGFGNLAVTRVSLYVFFVCVDLYWQKEMKSDVCQLVFRSSGDDMQVSNLLISISTNTTPQATKC